MSERPRILIVDDTPDNILLLAETLRDSYKVQVANSGPRALQLAGMTPAPDLILLDVMMPDMDGYEVCARLQENPATAHIPVIFVTALTSSGDEEKGLALGAVDYVTKPFNPTLVKARIHNHLELKAHRDHLEREVKQRTEELLQEALARQALENDLQLALKLQLSMLPPARHGQQGPHGFEVDACLRPARAIGGDLYDYIKLDNHRLLFALGDVSDKGVAAALFMVRVLTLLHWLAPSASEPADILAQLNKALCRENDACMFVTLGLGILDLRDGQVKYASGGHEPPVLIEPGRPAQLLELESGPALGLFETDFPSHQLQLTEQQVLMLVSDGVAEANDHGKQEYGFERLLMQLAGVQGPELPSILEQTLASIDAFTDGAEPSDDLTILLLRRR
jgi:sigma-B regulation protein RsbU (phosphoserine phosphatase)